MKLSVVWIIEKIYYRTDNSFSRMFYINYDWLIDTKDKANNLPIIKSF